MANVVGKSAMLMDLVVVLGGAGFPGLPGVLGAVLKESSNEVSMIRDVVVGDVNCEGNPFIRQYSHFHSLTISGQSMSLTLRSLSHSKRFLVVSHWIAASFSS